MASVAARSISPARRRGTIAGMSPPNIFLASSFMPGALHNLYPIAPCIPETTRRCLSQALRGGFRAVRAGAQIHSAQASYARIALAGSWAFCTGYQNCIRLIQVGEVFFVFDADG